MLRINATTLLLLLLLLVTSGWSQKNDTGPLSMRGVLLVNPEFARDRNANDGSVRAEVTVSNSDRRTIGSVQVKANFIDAAGNLLYTDTAVLEVPSRGKQRTILMFANPSNLLVDTVTAELDYTHKGQPYARKIKLEHAGQPLKNPADSYQDGDGYR